MDLSDGLFGDLAKICARSGVGALVEEAALPVPDAVRAAFPEEWLRLATRGGEDYELLFTADAATMDRLRALCVARDLPAPAVIGAITAPPADGPPIRLCRRDGREEPVGGGAFDHFAGG
jgi:thiamine-monophosphate kinase